MAWLIRIGFSLFQNPSNWSILWLRFINCYFKWLDSLYSIWFVIYNLNVEIDQIGGFWNGNDFILINRVLNYWFTHILFWVKRFKLFIFYFLWNIKKLYGILNCEAPHINFNIKHLWWNFITAVILLFYFLQDGFITLNICDETSTSLITFWRHHLICFYVDFNCNFS